MKETRSITGYVLLALSLLVIFYVNFQRAEVHKSSAWDVLPNLIGHIFIYTVIIAIGIAGLLLIYSSGDNKRKTILIIYLVGMAASFYYLHVKTTESKTPVYISASGPHVFLKLRIDSTYRLTNYAYHMGESWQEGTYSLVGNKIVLICKSPIEAGLDNELWIRRDTIYYGDAESDLDRVNRGLYLAILK